LQSFVNNFCKFLTGFTFAIFKLRLIIFIEERIKMRKISMKKLLLFSFSVLFVLTAVTAFSGLHPVDMDNSECVTCHSDDGIVANPNVVNDYKASKHNYVGVACGNCHGDEADFKPKPNKLACEPCHSQEVAKTASVLPCGRCHTVHKFTVHK
jgi:hypothetical protein